LQAFIAIAADRAAQKIAAEKTDVMDRPEAVESAPECRQCEELKASAGLSEWLAKRAAQIPAAGPLAAEQQSVPSCVPIAASLPEPFERPIEETKSTANVFIDEALLEAILSGSPIRPQAVDPATRPRFEVIEGSAAIPSGMHPAGALRRLLDADRPFTGLVFALSVTHNDGRAASQDVVLSVHYFVRNLLQDGDFACQSGPGEFVVLLPGDDAAASRSRLKGISERLWDFQLRGVGSFSVLFSWGDVLVNREPLAEAVDSASERMYQTRRGRKTVSMDFVSPRTAAVM
jgi:hypothetical protein